MMMKKIMFLMIILVAGLTSVNAQKGEDRKEKMMELKKAFLKERLNLNEKESAKFWPVYEKHAAEKKSLRKTMKDMKGKVKGNTSLTENEFIAFIDETSDLRIKEVALDKQYTKDVLSVLGLERTMKMKELERNFKKTMKEKRDDRGEKGGKRPDHRERPGSNDDN